MSREGFVHSHFVTARLGLAINQKQLILHSCEFIVEIRTDVFYIGGWRGIGYSIEGF
jgi:hypothetical protein